ncbi:MAG: ankyrin repeat domain-containing protein [Gemmatimonas sp.]
MTKPFTSSLAATLGMLSLIAASASAQDVASKTKVPASSKPMTGEKAAPTLANAAMRGDIAAVRAMLLTSKASINVAQGDGMTALHWAADRGDLAMAQLLMKSGANIKATTRLGGYTPLHVAAQQGRGEVVRALLAAGADPNVTTLGGSTALHYASETSSADAVAALLEYKANPNAREREWGQTPLMYAANANRAEAIKVLLKGKADPNLETESIELTTQAAADRLATARRNQVMESLAPQSVKDSIKAAQLKAAAALPTAGAARAPGGGAATAMVADANGAPPAAAAAAAALRGGGGGGGRGGGVNYAQFLTAAQVQEAITAGRKVLDSIDVVNATARATKAATVATAPGAGGRATATDTVADVNGNLSAAQFSGSVGAMGGLTALHHAVRQGNTAATLALIDGGANINERTASDSTTPLLMAVINGHFDLAMELIKRGADVKLMSTAGATPLYNAINTQWAPRSRYPQPQSVQNQKTTHLELMAALIKAGADVNVRLKKNLWYFGYNNCGNGNCGLEYLDGTTPFWRAAYAVDLDAMKMLVAAGADVNLPSIRPQPVAGGGRGGAGGGAAAGGAPGAAGAVADAGAAGGAAGAGGRGGRGGRGGGGGGGNRGGGGGAGAAVGGDGGNIVAGAGAAAGGAAGAAGGAAGGGGGGGGGGGRGVQVPLEPAIDSASKAFPPGIGVYAIHAVAGVGYGNGFAGNSHRHAPDGWMPAMKYVVEVLHADVNQRDNNGYTPLHHAAARGDNEMILYLVAHGADPKAVSRRGVTTIDIANGPVERLRPFPETIALLEKMGVHNSHKCVGC